MEEYRAIRFLNLWMLASQILSCKSIDNVAFIVDTKRQKPLRALRTVQRRLRNIPMSSLPKSFQDAVVVTRALVLVYLWIDSLCIIQDSRADWYAESSKVHQYYQNAFVTISALSAAGSHMAF
jgi:hypothetical protein